mmetsp:Transcript_27927/g.59484  ORF Transcript_27927/g.59484 Transcript_27927/m.59484 type:complete len:114 (-) Transcript_27927:2606-2947(-)
MSSFKSTGAVGGLSLTDPKDTERERGEREREIGREKGKGGDEGCQNGWKTLDVGLSAPKERYVHDTAAKREGPRGLRAVRCHATCTIGPTEKNYRHDVCDMSFATSPASNEHG